MTIDPQITAAAKLMVCLIESGYLPENLRRDIQTLMSGALAWELASGQVKTKDALTSG